MVKVVECGAERKRSIKEIYRKRKALQKRERNKFQEALSGGFRASLEQNEVQTPLAMKNLWTVGVRLHLFSALHERE